MLSASEKCSKFLQQYPSLKIVKVMTVGGKGFTIPTRHLYPPIRWDIIARALEISGGDCNNWFLEPENNS